jgi:hypothetical protein
MSDNYYDRSSRWVFDSDGNYLHSKRREFNPNVLSEGYLYSNEKEWERRFEEYHKELKERV